ncbi:hypothetical protein ABZX85_23240 [Streptomyces sp. NPDC004539]|uniref:hypothetical protein n=1 Tax=Streptomyces sp. NPDC004539 TaxID=3154280 RepID=UPI0033BE2589
MTTPTAYTVAAYRSERDYHLKRPDYTRTVHDEAGRPSAKERADELARELADRSCRGRLGWTRITITPAADLTP